MSKGEEHTLLANNAYLHAPGMHAPEPCGAHANDNCAHLVSSASQLACSVVVKGSCPKFVMLIGQHMLESHGDHQSLNLIQLCPWTCVAVPMTSLE